MAELGETPGQPATPPPPATPGPSFVTGPGWPYPPGVVPPPPPPGVVPPPPPPGVVPPPPPSGALPPPPLGVVPPPPPSGAPSAPAPPAPSAAGVPGSPLLLDRPEAAPRQRRDAGLWLILAVSGFLAGQIFGLIFTVVAAAAAGQGNHLSQIATMTEPPEWYVAASLLGLWCGFFGAPWLASRVRGSGRLIADLGLRFKVVDLAGIAIGIGGQVVVTVLYAPFIHHLKNFDAPTRKLTGASHGVGFAVIALLTVVGAPFFEELFFRGLLLRGLLRLFAPRGGHRGTGRAVAVVAAVAVDGVLFGLAHAEWEQLAGLALFGVALAVVSYRTGRLGMNMVAHGTFNLVAILALASNGGVLHL